MNSDIEIYIGKRLRTRRRLMGLTQQQLATLMGVRFQQIQKYECAVCTLSADRLWSLSRHLGVDIQYFFDGFAPSTGRESVRSPSLQEARSSASNGATHP